MATARRMVTASVVALLVGACSAHASPLREDREVASRPAQPAAVQAHAPAAPAGTYDELGQEIPTTGDGDALSR